MTTKDLFITDFSDAVFQDMFKQYFSELGMEVKDWDGLFAEMNEQNGGNAAYIRIYGKEPVGFIQFTAVTLENWFFKEKLGFIREFWTAEKFRRQGHGTELLSLAEKYFKDNGTCRIVLTPDENERQFYLNRGYSVCEGIEAKNNIDVFVKEI